MVGTIEGFHDSTGVLRIDIRPEYEEKTYLEEILSFAKENFYEFFQNEYLVTKAVEEASERREALFDKGWEFIDDFRKYKGYFKIGIK